MHEIAAQIDLLFSISHYPTFTVDQPSKGHTSDLIMRKKASETCEWIGRNITNNGGRKKETKWM